MTHARLFILGLLLTISHLFALQLTEINHLGTSPAGDHYCLEFAVDSLEETAATIRFMDHEGNSIRQIAEEEPSVYNAQDQLLKVRFVIQPGELDPAKVLGILIFPANEPERVDLYMVNRVIPAQFHPSLQASMKYTGVESHSPNFSLQSFADAPDSWVLQAASCGQANVKDRAVNRPLRPVPYFPTLTPLPTPN